MAERGDKPNRIAVGKTDRGAPSMSQAEADLQKIRAAQARYNENYGITSRGTDGRFTTSGTATDGRFPSRLVAEDPEDTTMELRAGLAGQPMPGQSSTGRTYAAHPDVMQEDVAYAARLQARQQLANKRQWIEGLFDTRDPAQRDLCDKLFPELTREKETIIEDRADLAQKLAKIRLRGMRTREDVELVYMVASGAIAPPQGPLWDPAQWGLEASMQTVMNRGLFNPNGNRSAKPSGGQAMWDPLATTTTGASQRVLIEPKQEPKLATAIGAKEGWFP